MAKFIKIIIAGVVIFGLGMAVSQANGSFAKGFKKSIERVHNYSK